MPELSPMDDGLEYQLSSFEEDGSDYQSTADMPDLSPVDDGSRYQPSSSEENGSEYHPSSSEEDESDYKPRRPHKTSKDIQVHQVSVTLNHHHLRADTDLEVGTVISIGETLELHDGSFLMITALWISKDGGSVEFDGHLFRRIDGFQEYLPATFGGSELVWLCEAKENDPKPKGYLRSAHSKDVLRNRHLVLTNSDCAPETVSQCQATAMVTGKEPLFCRWKVVAELSDSQRKGGAEKLRSILGRSKEQPKAFMALSRQELYNGGMLGTECFDSQQRLEMDAPTADLDGRRLESMRHGCSTSRELQTSKRRGRDVEKGLILGPNTTGSRIAKSRSQVFAPVKGRHSSAIRGRSSYREGNVTRTVRSPSLTGLLAPKQISEEEVYTLADAFCGAGGMSIGARDAGFRIKWAFDEDTDAIDTYSLNHGKDACKQISAENFLKPGNAYGTSKVHVLHLSPPCQGFTLACRGTPKNGEKDNECMTYVSDIVKKVEPRIVTFEEVREVLFRRRNYFTTMVLNLTSLGYNVRWRIIECVDLGLPQKRRRLFTIASCPGEPLPDFPTRTHAPSTKCRELGLRPWNSFGDAIDYLEASTPNHLLAHPRQVRNEERLRPRYSRDWPLHHAVTTGENWPDHYSGKYMCTVREAACLQGFPADYEFCGSLPATRRQVANAVPPPVAKAILEEVKRSLMRTDALRRSRDWRSWIVLNNRSIDCQLGVFCRF